MKYDQDKVDEMVLALLWLNTHEQTLGGHTEKRAWKGHDWDSLERLFAQGWIGDPKGKAKSMPLTQEGAQRSAELFRKHFGSGEP